MKELWILLLKWKKSFNFVIVLALNLECGVKSLIGQVVLCSKKVIWNAELYSWRLFLNYLQVAGFSSSGLLWISGGSSMSGRLTFSLEQQGPGVSFFHFCALQCWLLVIYCIICGSIILELCFLPDEFGCFCFHICCFCDSCCFLNCMYVCMPLSVIVALLNSFILPLIVV